MLTIDTDLVGRQFACERQRNIAMLGADHHLAMRYISTRRDLDVTAAGLYLEIARHPLQMDVFGVCNHTAGSIEIAPTDFVAGNFDFPGHRADLHIRARGLEHHALADLAEADVLEEVAIQVDRSGDFIHG